MTTQTGETIAKRSEPRERLLATASAIFYAEGIRGVGVDRIIAEAGVTKATFYRHFPGREQLVLAYLRATDALIRTAVESMALDLDPVKVLRAVGQGIGHDVCRPGFRGCAFINAAAEYPDPADPVHQVVIEHRAWFHGLVVSALERAGHPEPESAGRRYVMLRDGAMVAGYLSDADEAAATLAHGVEEIIQEIPVR